MHFADMNLLRHLDKVLDKADVGVEKKSQIVTDLNDLLYSDYAMGELSSLHAAAFKCVRCPDMKHPAVLPVWNVTDPKVVFVTDTPISGNHGHAAKDAMLHMVDALKTAGFSSSDIALTYATRCPTKEFRKPTSNEYQNCKSYLYSEIELLRPKLVVTLGLDATQQFLGPDVKLNEVIGEVRYIGPLLIQPAVSIWALKDPGRNLEDFTSQMQRAYDWITTQNQ